MVPDEFGTSVQLLGRLFSSLASCTAAAWLVVCVFFSLLFTYFTMAVCIIEMLTN